MPLRSAIGPAIATVALSGALALVATRALAMPGLSRPSEATGGSLPRANEATGAGLPRASEASRGVRLLDLSSVRRLFGVLARQRSSMTEGARVGAWADFTMMAAAVVGGEARIAPITFDALAATATGADGPRVAVTQGMGIRDEAAYQLLALGYSARETADVVSGRISIQALDNARRMIAVGLSREDAANYLDTQYRLVRASREPVRPRQGSTPRFASTAFDGLIDKYARLHNVESSIVRAIIATESAFNPAARSHAGAIGLMQLMPMTARELGVNPFIPEENIEGGVRYFAQLLRMFGRLELALIAYNGGPGFAERYARGQTALYGETRDYVRKVLSRLGATQP